MNNQPVHILNQMGVISSFSVAKKITESDINKFFRRHKRHGKKTSEISKLLHEKVISEIEEAMLSHKIPGILNQQELAAEMGVDKNIIANMPELDRLMSVVTQKLTEKKYDQMSLCYFINGMVNSLGLSEEDFEKFHQQNDDEDGGEDEDDSYCS